MKELTKKLNIKFGLLFSKLGVTPNTWSFLSLLPALGGFLMLYQGELLYALILFASSSVIGAIDGAVARVTQSTSNLGAFLNGIIDRYIELLFYVGLYLYLQGTGNFILPISLWMILLVFGSIMPSFIQAYAGHREAIRDEEILDKMSGVFGRTWRMILLYIGMLLGLNNILYLIYVIALTAVLTNLASLQRVFYVVRKAR